jgi:hypothetical protein
MVQTAIRMKTRVLPGKRIEVTAPELPDEGDVELVIYLPETVPAPQETPRKFANVMEYIESLTPIQRTPEEWKEVEREFHEERNSWGD